jgi:inorganic pyrophosphatase
LRITARAAEAIAIPEASALRSLRAAQGVLTLGTTEPDGYLLFCRDFNGTGRYPMPSFVNLPSFTDDGDVHVVVETPRGSRAKFDYDPKLETFVLSKSLLTGLTYPHDWGFVPSTKADDGDPLDIMVIHDAATFPGMVVTCRLIGVLQIEQKSKKKSERNDRLFAVPRRSHSERSLKDVADLSKPIRRSLRSFHCDRRA